MELEAIYNCCIKNEKLKYKKMLRYTQEQVQELMDFLSQQQKVPALEWNDELASLNASHAPEMAQLGHEHMPSEMYSISVCRDLNQPKYILIDQLMDENQRYNIFSQDTQHLIIHTRCLETETMYDDGGTCEMCQETFIMYIGEPRELPPNPVVEQDQVTEIVSPELKIETGKEGKKLVSSR